MTAAPTKLEEELRACPFCGNRLRVRTNINPMGQCDTDGCWMHERQIAVALDVPRQIAGWNARATEAELASLRTRAETAEALAEALKPFAHLEKAIGIAAGIPDKVQGVVAFKVPRREEWCEFGPIPLGAFRALARAARTLTKEPPDAK